MKIAVIYQSRYGFTQQYAAWIAEELEAELLVARQVKPADLARYTTIVYGGGLYAGGVGGISLLTKNPQHLAGKALYLFTVGAADVTNKENIHHIRTGLEKALPPSLWKTARLYHLRGGICYSKMGVVHRCMMHLMMRMTRKKPESQRDAEDRMMLETYGQDIQFTSRDAIAPLVANVRAGI